MRITRAVLPILSVGSLLACGPDSAGRVFAPAPVLDLSTPVHVVTGGGKVDVTPIWPGADEATIAFTASVDGYGVATGQLQASFSVPDEMVHMDLSCLSVSGNEAWIGGVVTKSHPTGTFLGRVFIIRVQDNGEGMDATPDRISHFRGGATPARCLNQPTGVEFDLHFPWVKGNVQVR